MFSSILAVAALGLGTFDGEEAVAKSTRLLRSLGVTSTLNLQTVLLQTGMDRHSKVWFVAFSTPEGAASVCLDPHNGRPTSIQVSSSVADPNVSNQPPNKVGTSQMWTAMRKLGYGRDLRLGSGIGYVSGPASGDFYLLVHGLPFFTLNPTYAHWISVSPRTGAIRDFRASAEPPSVNAWRAKVPPSTALKRLRAWGHARALAKGLPKEVDPSEGDLRPELGYWKFAGEPTARLVWRATKYTKINGLPYGLGSLRMFVDALDGSLREPDDNAWGMNP